MNYYTRTLIQGIEDHLTQVAGAESLVQEIEAYLADIAESEEEE